MTGWALLATIGAVITSARVAVAAAFVLLNRRASPVPSGWLD